MYRYDGLASREAVFVRFDYGDQQKRRPLCNLAPALLTPSFSIAIPWF